MDVFDLRYRVVGQYAAYVRSFPIRDPDTGGYVDRHLDAGQLWSEPLGQLNPSFQPGASVDQLVAEGTLQTQCSRIFQRGKTPTSFGRRLTPAQAPGGRHSRFGHRAGPHHGVRALPGTNSTGRA